MRWLCAIGSWLIDPNNLTAISTLIIAIFTIVLAGVGIAQAILLGKTIKLARDEFNATHRPKLFVHMVAVTDKGQSGVRPAKGVITIVNAGDSPAFVIEWRATIYHQSNDAAFFPGLDTAETQVPKLDAAGIAPGQWQDIGHSQIHAVDNAWDQFVNEGGRMFFLGRITYQGSDGVHRNVGFCREYDAKIEGAWCAVKHSEYEYSY